MSSINIGVLATKKSAVMPHASVYIDRLSCLVTFYILLLQQCRNDRFVEVLSQEYKCHALLFVHAHCVFAAVSSSAHDKGYRHHTKVSKPSLAVVD